MNTDGNTDAINRHIDESEAYDEQRKLLQEMQDLRDEVDTLNARLAEVTAERDNWRDAAEHWKDERKLRERAYDLKGQEEQLLRRAEAAEAMLPRAYRAGVEAGDVVAIEQSISAVLGEGGDVRSAAQYVVTCIRTLPTPTIEQLKETMKENDDG